MMDIKELEVSSYILYVPEFLAKREQAYETVKLERRPQIKGTDKWGIFKSNNVFNKDSKEFTYEGMPSSRSGSILENTRFNSAQEALDFWKNCIVKYEAELKMDWDVIRKIKKTL